MSQTLTESPAERLADIRESIVAENVSYGELAELADLAEHIDPSDVLLLEWAGVPEFPEEAAPAPGHHTWYVEVERGNYTTFDLIDGKIVRAAPSTARDIAQATMQRKIIDL